MPGSTQVHRGRWLGVALTGLVLSGFSGSLAVQAQEQIRDFTRPILVLNPVGHHAPVRSLVFTPEGQLLSGGLDKVVNVWRVKGARPALEATIRPPIWRGLAGTIYALALSPVADQGQRVLAVAGYGVEARRGNIGLFRFPGSNAITTGDHFAELLNDDPNDPNKTGHGDTVTSLAFDPRGTLLASGSNDATARIWDWKNRRTTAVLRGHVGPINALAFLPDGSHLVTGGRDGTLRLWDITRPQAPIASAPPPAPTLRDPLAVQINALAVTRDGRWVVIGREDGFVIRYDMANLGLAGQRILSTANETIEALALSHDGTRLVSSSIAWAASKSVLPRLTCSLQIRSFPDGANRREIRKLDSVAYACSFSPDDRTLGVAGGDRQSVFLLTDYDDAARTTTVELKGQGRSIWDVGLRSTPDGLAVGFSHDPNQNPRYPPPAPGGARPAGRYYGMIFATREQTSFLPGDLSHSLDSYAGWTIRPIDQFHLQVTQANPPGRTFVVALDEVKDRRWWCYSFIPGGPQHARPTVAVGCETGVWFYRLEDGQPTRFYAGHSSPVYCLAPSKDGRWLATGSSDQTVRLWTLAGCDTPPVLGAVFEKRADGSRQVKSVEPLSFAEAMGLKAGDIPVKFAFDTEEVTADDFMARYEAQRSNTFIQIIVQRQVEPRPENGPAQEEIPLGTTRRNSPALTLFLGEDREWVIWMPSGYYDTSIDGDTKFLGWHLNQATIFDPKPTDYLEIIKFEKILRQPRRSRPNKLDTLLQTANLGLAMSVPFPRPELLIPVPQPAEDGRIQVRPDGARPPAAPPAAPPALPPILVFEFPQAPQPAPAAPDARALAMASPASPPATPAPALETTTVPPGSATPTPAPESPPASPRIVTRPGTTPAGTGTIQPPATQPLPPVAQAVPRTTASGPAAPVRTPSRATPEARARELAEATPAPGPAPEATTVQPSRAAATPPPDSPPASARIVARPGTAPATAVEPPAMQPLPPVVHSVPASAPGLGPGPGPKPAAAAAAAATAATEAPTPVLAAPERRTRELAAVTSPAVAPAPEATTVQPGPARVAASPAPEAPPASSRIVARPGASATPSSSGTARPPTMQPLPSVAQAVPGTTGSGPAAPVRTPAPATPEARARALAAVTSPAATPAPETTTVQRPTATPTPAADQAASPTSPRIIAGRQGRPEETVKPPTTQPLPSLAGQAPAPAQGETPLTRPTLPAIVFQLPAVIAPIPAPDEPPVVRPAPGPVAVADQGQGAGPREARSLVPAALPPTLLIRTPAAPEPPIPLLARVPAAPAFPPPQLPAGPAPRAGQGALAAALLPLPVSPAEFVERSQPPTIKPLIQPLPNQQITTLDGQPIDPRDVPPDKIALNDLDPNGRGNLQLDLLIDAQGRSPARSLDYRIDGKPLRQNPAFDRPVSLHREGVKLSLAPGPHRFTAEVENVLGISRTLTRDIFVKGPARPSPSRVRVLTIAPSFQEKLIPAVRFADRDSRDLRKFFNRYLVSPRDGAPAYSIDELPVEGLKATADLVKKSISSLKDEALGEGDVVIVVIESHFINVGNERRLVAADGLNLPPSPAILADDLARDLGAIALQGCKVLVLIDGVHTASSKVWDTDINEWVRHLRDDHKVIAFVASNSGPSQFVRDQGHRAFAQAVLDSIRPTVSREGTYLLNDFRDIVIERVLSLTGRQQQAACYLPDTLNGQFPIINPQPTGR
jgi:WD40 repeat protein